MRKIVVKTVVHVYAIHNLTLCFIFYRMPFITVTYLERVLCIIWFLQCLVATLEYVNGFERRTVDLYAFTEKVHVFSGSVVCDLDL